MFPFPNLEGCTVFPLPEGSQLEFKQSFRSSMSDKIIATICAILNTGGGYLVIGVQDTDRVIIGIKTDKDMDCFLLMLDSIYHHSHILKKDGSPVNVGAITSRVVRTTNNKDLLVVTINAEPGEKYSLKDGTVWYRLSASNFKQTALPAMYTQTELNAFVKKRLSTHTAVIREQFAIEKKNIIQTHTRDIEKLKEKFKGIETDFKTVIGAAKKNEETLNTYRTLLYDSILTRKNEAEQHFDKQEYNKQSSIFSIIANTICCLCPI
jgi:predicted HTH transcriptional regulator